MNRQETINSIKTTLKKLFSTEYKFAEYLTTDGMKIVCDGEKIEVGSGVQGMDGEGNLIPLNDGTYELTDGLTINVVSGKIESLMESGSEVPEEPESEMAEVGKSITPTVVNPKEEEMAGKVKTIEDNMAEILGMIKDMAKIQTEMKYEMEEFKKSPASTPVKNEKKGGDVFNTNFSRQMKMSEIDEIRKIISEKNKASNNLAL